MFRSPQQIPDIANKLFFQIVLTLKNSILHIILIQTNSQTISTWIINHRIIRQ